MKEIRHLAAVVVAVALAGCSSDGSKTNNVKIAWVTKGKPIRSVFDPGRTGAPIAGQDLSAASGRTVTVDVRETESVDPAAQIDLVRGLLDEGYDGIGISVLDAAGMTPVIDLAAKRGIHVFTYDSDAPESQRETFYSMSNTDGGREAGRLLAVLTGGIGQVAIMDSSDGGLNFVERVGGFTEELAQYPNLEIVDTVQCGAPEEAATDNCTTVLEDWLTAYPDLAGVYFSRAAPLRDPQLRSKAPLYAAAVDAGQLFAVGFDTTPDQLASMSAGLVHALIGQKYFGWGYDVSTMLYDSITRGIRYDPFVDSGFDVVCTDNVDEMIAIWQAENFRAALTPCSL